MKKTSMTKAEVIWATNEWWRRYRDDPESFGREFQAVAEVTAAEAEGREPTLGDNEWRYRLFLLEQRAAAKTKPKTKPEKVASRGAKV
jgi:hypothetical protein